MQVKVTLTMKDEELKKIMQETGLTKPDEIKGYLHASEKRNIEWDFGNRYDIDVKVDDMDDKLKKLREELRPFKDSWSATFSIKPIDTLFINASIEPKVKEVKRHAKVGEWIKITTDENVKIDPWMYGEERYKRGDIFKVYKISPCYASGVYCELNNKVKDSEGNLVNSFVVDNGNLVIDQKEYVVLENYEPEDGENK